VTRPRALWPAALLAWLLLLGLAVANGALREFLLLPLMGEPAARLLSPVILAPGVLILGGLFAWYAGPRPAPVLLGVGLLWLLLALMFEFCFFHFVRGVPWTVLLADYNILAGRLLALVWIATLLGPWLGGRLLGYY
jgi:hypothetical protein